MNNEENTSTDPSLEFTNLDEYLTYYTDMGFKLVKDEESNGTRTLTLRSYTGEEFSEAIVKDNGSKISLMQTLNGKPYIMR